MFLKDTPLYRSSKHKYKHTCNWHNFSIYAAEDRNHHQYPQGQRWRNRQHQEAMHVDGGRTVGVGGAASEYNRQEGMNADGNHDV